MTCFRFHFPNLTDGDSMRITDIIAKKRDGYELSDEEIHFFVKGAADGSIPDYQLSALLMAICIRSMNERETLTLTLEMTKSGDVVDLSAIDGIKADKHSTGGVGDKVTLIIAPIVAACGIKVAKMSGRGLGHTGGTVDKFESIPGFCTSLSVNEFIDTVNTCGMSVIGQSGDLCPADKKLYSLRDVTATVESIPLIASSIMSKKLAAGADVIVLDVKCGNGAFMKDFESARALAEEMVKIGKGAGRQIAAMITDMNVPLGNNIGNALEVIEAVDVLNGNGPSDLIEASLSVAAKILELSGKGDYEACRNLAISKITDGSALKKLAECVALQRGNSDCIFDPSKLSIAPFAVDFVAEKSGYISSMDSSQIGITSVILGAGRTKADDKLDHGAGVVLKRKTGDRVEKGECVAVFYSSDEKLFAPALEKFKSAITISEERIRINKTVLDIVE